MALLPIFNINKKGMAEDKNYPVGWALKKEFVDIDGVVYHKGVEKRELKGTLPTSVIMRDGYQVYPPVPDAFPEQEGKASVEHSVPSVETSPEKDPAIAALEQQNITLMEKLSRLEQVLMSGSMAGNQTTQVIVKEEKPVFGEKHTGRDITPEDFVDEQKTYHMFGRGYVMSSYHTRRGEIKLAPYNAPIYFTKSFDEVRNDGSNSRVIPFCSYRTNSRKEMEFVENHPLYGIMIYENHSRAVKATESDNIVKLETIVNKFQQMGDRQLFSLAAQYNIDKNLDISEIRNKLVWLEVNREVESEKTQQALRRGEVEKEKSAFAAKE